VKDIPIARAMG